MPEPTEEELDALAEERYWRDVMERFKPSDVPWIDPTKAIPWVVERMNYEPPEATHAQP